MLVAGILALVAVGGVGFVIGRRTDQPAAAPTASVGSRTPAPTPSSVIAPTPPANGQVITHPPTPRGHWDIGATRIKKMTAAPGTLYVGELTHESIYQVKAIDTRTGEQLWSTDPPSGPLTFAAFELVGDALVVISADANAAQPHTTFAFYDRSSGAARDVVTVPGGPPRSTVDSFVVNDTADGKLELRTIDPTLPAVSDPVQIDNYVVTNDGTFVAMRDGMFDEPDALTMRPTNNVRYPHPSDAQSITHTDDGHFVAADGGLITGFDSTGAAAWTFDPGLGSDVELKALGEDIVMASSATQFRPIEFTEHEAHPASEIYDGTVYVGNREPGAVPTFLMDWMGGRHIITVQHHITLGLGQVPGLDDPLVAVIGHVLYTSARPDEDDLTTPQPPLQAFDATTGAKLWELALRPGERVFLEQDGFAVYANREDSAEMTPYVEG